MDEEYDAIILGTGLKECIVSGLLAVAKKKVRARPRPRPRPRPRRTRRCDGSRAIPILGGSSSRGQAGTEGRTVTSAPPHRRLQGQNQPPPVEPRPPPPPLSPKERARGSPDLLSRRRSWRRGGARQG